MSTAHSANASACVLAAVHWKDSKASYRGYTGPTPTKEMHAEEILYRDLGAGGVDHPAIRAMLNERGYDGWITLDCQASFAECARPRAHSAIIKTYLTKQYFTATSFDGFIATEDDSLEWLFPF